MEAVVSATSFLHDDLKTLASDLNDLWKSGSISRDTIVHLYHSSPLSACLLLCLLVMVLCFVAGELTGNLSQVDKLWSLVPAAYMWIIVTHPKVSDASGRLWLMSVLVQLWSLRLTFNFWRRGGYTWPPWAGEEDYRWEYVRKFWFMSYLPLRLAFHAGFICIYQHLLLLALVLPAFAVVASNDNPINLVDIVASVTFLTLLVGETLADQQQWNFQTKKYSLKNAGNPLPPPYSDGFLKSGLWHYSAHPNYASEQAMWVVLYLFAVAASGNHSQWMAAAGSVNLICLFKPSVDLSEGITLGKYGKKYSNYLSVTPRFFSFKILVPAMAFIAAAPSFVITL